MTPSLKSPLLILSFSLLTICTVLAQDSLQVTTTLQKTDVVVSRMERELTLSKAQTQRVSIILRERFETLSKSTADKTKQLATANDIATKKLSEVLTPQQLALYNQIRSGTKKQKDEFLKKNSGYKFTDQEKEMDF